MCSSPSHYRQSILMYKINDQKKQTHGNRDWRLYERFIATLRSKESSREKTILSNAKLIGCISGVERQIDLLIDLGIEKKFKGPLVFSPLLYH